MKNLKSCLWMVLPGVVGLISFLSVNASTDFLPYAEPPLSVLPFNESSSQVNTNPERGLYVQRSTTDFWGINTLRGQGITVVLVAYDIKKFATMPLSSTKITELRNALQQLRSNGLKGIFRAAYGYTDQDYYADPKDMNVIRTHIGQIAAVLKDFQDVVFAIQAGMLGPWGEWHSSNWGNPPSRSARQSVLFAWLDALPPQMSVSLRTPWFIQDTFADQPGGSTLTSSLAYSGSRLSRVGFHNDCFLSSPTDYGTYGNRAVDLSWYNNHGRFAPFGGETCAVAPQSDITNAVSEMTLLHAQYLNRDYNVNVLNKWRNSSYNGINAFDYILRKMGYRFVLMDSRISSAVLPGGVLHLVLNLKNTGFASLHNPRTVQVVLERNGQKYIAPVAVDPRRWEPESGTLSLNWFFRLPSSISVGTWNVYLNLPDPADGLTNDPRYSIQLANQGTWQAVTGYNLISNNLTITTQTTGSVESGTVFKQISEDSIPTQDPLVVDGKVTTPNEWNMLPLITKSTGSLQSVKVAQDATSLIFGLEGVTLDQFPHVSFFLNTDDNTSTGYRTGWANSGAEFMIEDGQLYQYSGDGTSWAWIAQGKVAQYSPGSAIVELKLALSSLGTLKNSNLGIGIQLKDKNWAITEQLPISQNALPILKIK